jgi:phosphoribosylamine-glycine ligase
MSDAAVLEVLRAVPHLTVYDGYPTADEENKVILVDLPYIVFVPTTPRDRDVRFNAQAGGRVEEFRLTGVGETTEQAKAVLERARAVLNRRWIAGGLCRRDVDSLPVDRDFTYNRPDGGPIFYGVDPYTLPI